MKVINWNVRGANRPFKQQEIRTMLHSNNVSLLGINESRVHPAKSSKIINSLFKGWKYLDNYESHPNGRIWVLWDPSILEVTKLVVSTQMIHVAVHIIQKQLFFQASFVYGLNSYMERTDLWSSIHNLFSSMNQIP